MDLIECHWQGCKNIQTNIDKRQTKKTKQQQQNRETTQGCENNQTKK